MIMEDSSSEILTKIYIGQNIRDEGILQSSISDSKNEVSNLVEKGLIYENYWYSHALYLTTTNGANIARSLIEKQIETCGEEIKDYIASFPPRLAGFLIHDYLTKSLDFPEYVPEYMVEYWLDLWKTHILKDSRIWSKRTEILSKLERLGICVRTNYYVSTGGGQLRESRYVISPEVRELLLEVSPPYGLTEEENRNCRLYHFLKEIAVWLDRPVIEETRERYLNEMQRLDIDEADIEEVINKLAKEGITASYLGIAVVDRKPYIIKDKVGYSFYLQNLLIKPIITNLLESKRMTIVEQKGNDQTQVLQRIIKLVEAKYTLTRNAGFLGINLFDSTPDTEVCITRMLKIPTTDGELKEFIEVLYNYIIDRSKDWLLKIGNIKTGEMTMLEKEITAKGKSIPAEFSTGFEKAIQDLRIVNNLRNKLSHSKAAKDWEDIGNIYRKLINNPLPQSKEDYIEVQENLLDKVAQSLESLSQIFMKIIR